MIVKFKSSMHDFVRNKYEKSSDRHKLSDEELEEVLMYKNISKEFKYYDWFGDCERVEATLVKVTLVRYKDLVFTVEINKDIPEHYVPTPSQVLEEKGLLFPTCVSSY